MNLIIDQRRAPGVTRLFADYLYDFGKLARFYGGGAPYDLDALAASAAKRAYPGATRQSAAAVLARQNRGWSTGTAAAAKTEELLDLFAQPKTVAVLTGQQVGIGGGPLLAIHKAMTAVRLAAALRERGVPAVPIFWMASQDHDLEEVSQLWALDATSQPQRLKLAIPAAPDAPVGRLTLGAEVEIWTEDLARLTGAPLDELRACYRPGVSLTQAFASLFSRWFAPWGLLLFDPLDAPPLDAVWAPHYRAVAERHADLELRLHQRDLELTQAGYHTQVQFSGAPHLLCREKGGARQPLRPPLAPALLREVESEPGLVSPTALLRPVMQDAAFPTVAFVTGPAETAYLAQSTVLYEALGVPMPVIWPRASVTLVDPKAQRLLQKYQLDLLELWTTPAQELLARRALPESVELQVQAMRAQLDTQFERLRANLQQLDATLVDATQGAEQKIRHQLEQLEARVARSFARRHEEIAAQAQHLSGTLFPRRDLQERVLGAAPWVARFPRIPQQLYDSIIPTAPGHLALEL